jgi:hypothetical protein
MKKYSLPIVIIAVLLCLISGLIFAQDDDTPLNPNIAHNRDQSQYDGQATTPNIMDAPDLPASMDLALVPCADGAPGPCDLIATRAEDIVGVWKQYLGGPRFHAPGGVAFIRYNVDGTYVIADSVENTAQPLKGYPSGTFSFDGAQFIIGPTVGAPAPCDVAPHYQLRVLKYGSQSVALRYIPISEACPTRLQDLSQALVWVSS